MAYTSLIHLKTLLMVLTAAGGTVTGGVLANSYVNSANRDPGSFLITLNPSTMWTVQGASSTSTITVTSINGFSGTVTLSLYFPGTTLTASISPTSVSVPSNSIAESTLHNYKHAHTHHHHNRSHQHYNGHSYKHQRLHWKRESDSHRTLRLHHRDRWRKPVNDSFRWCREQHSRDKIGR